MEYAFALHLPCLTLNMFLCPLMSLKICHQQTEQVHSQDFYLSPIIKGARIEYIRVIQWWVLFINFYQHR